MSNTRKQEMPEWFDGKKINEILFCEAFRKEHPMICISCESKTISRVKNTTICCGFARWCFHNI